MNRAALDVIGWLDRTRISSSSPAVDGRNPNPDLFPSVLSYLHDLAYLIETTHDLMTEFSPEIRLSVL